MKRITSVLVAALLLIQGNVAAAAWYPNNGDFYYNSGNFADSYLLWGSPGPFTDSDVGYEHDLDVGNAWANVCTAWTNLPSGYDDCPTMNLFDPSGRAVATFGSFHINNVAPNTYYTGNWTLKRRDCGNCFVHDPVGSTTAHLRASEVDRTWCGYDWIYCMGGIRSTFLLVNMPLSVGTAHYETWAY